MMSTTLVRKRSNRGRLPVSIASLVAAMACVLLGNGLLAVPARAAALPVAVANAGVPVVRITRVATVDDVAAVADLDVHDGDVVALRFTATGSVLGDATVRISIVGCDAGTLAGAAPAEDGTFLLHAGATLAWTCRHAVVAADPSDLAPTIGVHDALAAGVAGDLTLASDSLHLSVVRPGLELAERLVPDAVAALATGDAAAVRPEVTVRNTGSVDLLVNVRDPHCPDGFDSSVPTGSDGMIDELAPGATLVLSCTLLAGRIPAGSSTTVTATGADRSGGIVSAATQAQALRGPTAVAGASQAPIRIRGRARLFRPVGCQRAAFLVELSGQQVRWASLLVDGHLTRFTNRSPDGNVRTLLIDVRKLGPGRHLLQATVRFRAAAQTPARAVTRHFRVCAGVPLAGLPD